MKGHVERDDTESSGDGLIVEQVPVLPAVGTSGMQAEQRNTLTGFLEIHAVGEIFDFDVQISANDGFHVRHWRQSSPAPTGHA